VAAIAVGEVSPKAEKPYFVMKYYVYVLKSCSKSRFYTGHSSDYKKRLLEHNSGKVKSTKGYVPWKIIHLEEYESKSDAFKREMQIKSFKSGSAFKNLLENSARRDG
jgi:putative endonuclease